MATARKEAAVITSEIAITARASAVAELGAAGRTAGMEMINPVGVRHAVEMSVKESLGESSLLHLPPPSAPTTLSTSTSTLATSSIATSTAPSLTSTSASSTRTLVSQTIQQDLGVTLREAISNAGQTGLEEQTEQLVDMAKAMGNGNLEGGLERLAGTA
ncbi:hypothetical protein P7C73_g2245, partial [Tremellales sp. Uapishka_1]